MPSDRKTAPTISLIINTAVGARVVVMRSSSLIIICLRLGQCSCCNCGKMLIHLRDFWLAPLRQDEQRQRKELHGDRKHNHGGNRLLVHHRYVCSSFCSFPKSLSCS